MRDIARRKEGPRAPLFRLLIALLLVPLPGSAQDAVERSELARCASLPEAAERLACFESLAVEPPLPEDALPPPSEAEESTPDSNASSAPPSTTTAPVVDVVPGDRPAVAEKADPAPPAPARSEPGSASMPPDELGAEHLDREADEDRRRDRVSATVEEVWKGGNRLLYFRFANGQIWRQMESGYFHYPRDSAFDVTIRQGFMGDYQMRRTGSARMTRIVRVK